MMYKCVMSIQALHQEGIREASQYLKSERKLISILVEMDKLKAHVTLGHSSLHQCVVKDWKLSDSCTATLISIARKSKEVPILKEKVDREEITITNARMIAPILNFKNSKE